MTCYPAMFLCCTSRASLLQKHSKNTNAFLLHFATFFHVSTASCTCEKNNLTQKLHQKCNHGYVFDEFLLNLLMCFAFISMGRCIVGAFFYCTKNAARRTFKNTTVPQLTGVKNTIGFIGHAFFFGFC